MGDFRNIEERRWPTEMVAGSSRPAITTDGACPEFVAAARALRAALEEINRSADHEIARQIIEGNIDQAHVVMRGPDSGTRVVRVGDILTRFDRALTAIEGGA